MADTSSFGELLRQHRLAQGLTQEALAERADMSERSIRALEGGGNRPQQATARRLADGLALSDDDRRRFLSAALPIPRRRAGAARTPCVTSLPPPATPLLGREREMAEVASLLTEPGIQVVSLTGPGGVGKTRLALEVARNHVDGTAMQAVFVSLAPLGDPVLVLSAVARALGLTEGANQPLLARLIPTLQDEPLLLVLDNFEHLLDAASDLVPLRAACPHLRLLVTSRSPLRLRGEQVYPVHPLAVPSGYGSGSISDALTAVGSVPAVRLFTARARAVRPDFALTTANGWAVAEICRHLDGLPLAIELAAARAPVLSPQALLVQLAHPLRLLTGGARDLPERQRTLGKAIAWSYDLLGGDEQVLFRRLGVFAGGCELDAIERVCVPNLSVPVLEGVSALSEANLLVAQPGDEPRFRMLETIRQFALERLDACGEGDEIRQRHAAYYLELAERVNAHFMGPQQADMFRLLDRELDNIRAVLRWSRESGDRRTTLRLAAALFYYWYIRGYRNEGRGWLQETLALTSPEERTAERAAALLAAGGLGNLLGDFYRARLQLEESVAIARNLGERRLLCAALTHLSITCGVLGEGERSWAVSEETLAIARKDGDLAHVGLTLHGMGVGLAWERRDFTAARARYEESLDAFRTLGSNGGMALVINSLGDMARMLGDLPAARRHYEESLELSMDSGSKSQQAVVLHNLGHTRHGLGCEWEAREDFRHSLLLFRDMGDTRGVAECVAGLACLEAARHPRLTARWFGAARAAVTTIGTELSASNAGQYDSALAMARAALDESEFEAALSGRPIGLEMAAREALAAESP